MTWELINYNVRVVTICPGEVATSMQEQAIQVKLQGHEMHVPSKVAGKIFDLVSDENKNNYQSGLTGDIGLGCF